MSLIGALTKAAKAGEAAKKTAPFYSAVDEALANIARPKGTGAEFLTELSKQPGVKKAELADRKLEQAFKAKGKITKEEAQQILKENPPPKLQERQLTEISDAEREEALRDKMERTGYESWDEVPRRVMRKWNDEIDHDLEKFGDYKLPGGQNYREILLKLPKLDTANGDKNYWSTHFLQDPNVLAHMRVQDRVGPNGEKILHVEEIQSDWHQTGRKKGYKPEDYIEQSNALDKEFNDLGDRRAQLLKQAELIPTHGPEFTSLIDEANSITPKLMRLQEQRDNLQNVINYGVPDAPFKKNWHELAMKRLLNYAADKGYDSIAITPGSEQAKRYPRQVETEKIAQEQGMKGFYDQILPSYLNTFGKPYGAQVQQLQVPVKHELQGLRNMGGYPEEPPLTMHNFPITPEMREAIKQKGLPLYQQIGVPTAGAGAASQMPEPEEGLAGGGIVNSLAKTEALAKLAKLREQMAPRAEAVKNLIAKDANSYLRDVVPNSLTNPEIEAEIARMAAKTPQIIKPSGLTELKKIVEQQKGGYGARRVERAADEIPNLEKMYQQEALQQAFTGDNAKALMTMNPADFEKYAIPLEKRVRMGPKAKELALRGEIDKYTVPTDELVKYLANLDDGFQHLPYLNIFKDELGLPVRPNIVGHEGRHRNRALAERGETSGLVQLNPSGDLREGMPRRSQEEFIEALKQELESTNKLVYPESDRSNIRPPIILPDVYAKGGSVKRQVKKADGGAINYNTAPDMSDGGRIIQGAPFKHGGKVNITTNRDAMFMELSNKKLKRK